MSTVQLSSLKSDIIFWIDTGSCRQHVYDNIKDHSKQEIQKAIKELKLSKIIRYEGKDSFLMVNWREMKIKNFRYDNVLNAYAYEEEAGALPT
jgi:hypothetical protein